MYILHKIIYEFERPLAESPVLVFKEIDDLILKFIWKSDLENKHLEDLYYMISRIVIKLQQ